MGHDATKVLLGSTRSSDRTVTCENGDPATFRAGLAVRRTSTDTLQLDSSNSAALIGISLGRDLSGLPKKTSVCRTGKDVPLRVVPSLVKGSLTFLAKVPARDITIEFVDGGTAGSEVVTVTGRKISVSMEDGASTATQLKAKLDAKAEALALIGTTIASGEGSTAQDAFALDGVDNFGFVVVGQPVELSATTGMGTDGGDATAAKWTSGVLDGVAEDGTTVAVALVDLVGGF